MISKYQRHPQSWGGYTPRSNDIQQNAEGCRDPEKQSEGTQLGTLLPLRGLDKARHLAPTALKIKVQWLRNSLYMAVEGPSTSYIVFSMIPSWCLLRICFTIFDP